MSSVTYDDLGFPDNYYTNGVQDLSMDFDDETGNLLSRTDHLKAQEETFDYDQTDRLTKAQVENLNTNTMQTPLETSYENNGNIASKSDAREYTYDNIRTQGSSQYRIKQHYIANHDPKCFVYTV